MSRKPQPARSGDRSRTEMTFDRPQLLPQLFGQYDQNLVAVENRLGVFITARGDRVGLEGSAESVAQARDVIGELYRRLQRGEDIDTGLIDAVIAMAAEPTLDGIVQRSDGDDAPPIMIRTRKKTIVPRSATQVGYMQCLARDDIIFALGPAGTGKTYVAVAQAVSQLITGSVQRLILSRPAVEAGERLGFLPGDMKDKVDPYLRPLYDALYDCLPAEQVERRIASGEIEVAPLAFMRGRTLADAFIILDEAQNTTIPQMKMFLTRFGMNSRMVVCGDPKQVDLPMPSSSGLADAVTRLEGVEGMAVVRFTAGDVVRHPIVGRIVEAYEGPDA
jgi:phosphate starvation-inducible protein PhoH and related proteins